MRIEPENPIHPSPGRPILLPPGYRFDGDPEPESTDDPGCVLLAIAASACTSAAFLLAICLGVALLAIGTSIYPTHHGAGVLLAIASGSITGGAVAIGLFHITRVGDAHADQEES